MSYCQFGRAGSCRRRLSEVDSGFLHSFSFDSHERIENFRFDHVNLVRCLRYAADLVVFEVLFEAVPSRSLATSANGSTLLVVYVVNGVCVSAIPVQSMLVPAELFRLYRNK